MDYFISDNADEDEAGDPLWRNTTPLKRRLQLYQAKRERDELHQKKRMSRIRRRLLRPSGGSLAALPILPARRAHSADDIFKLKHQLPPIDSPRKRLVSSSSSSEADNAESAKALSAESNNTRKSANKRKNIKKQRRR